MAAIETENEKLRGVLYRDFGRLPIDAGKIGDLLAIVGRMKSDPKNHNSRDIFGEVYEYFLGNFALEEGQKAGQFWGPLVFGAITGGTQTQHWRGGGLGRSLI